MPFTSFYDLPRDDHLTFVPAVVLVYRPSLEVALSFIGSALLFYMTNYTFSEYTNMLLLYGKARRPHCQTLSYTLFAKVYQQTSEMGTFTASRSDCGAPWRCHTPELEETVLHAVEEDAMTSAQRVARRLNVN